MPNKHKHHVTASSQAPKLPLSVFSLIESTNSPTSLHVIGSISLVQEFRHFSPTSLRSDGNALIIHTYIFISDALPPPISDKKCVQTHLIFTPHPTHFPPS